MWIFLALLLAAVAVVVLFLNQASFGRMPGGERLVRIKKSPHYRDGSFHNLSPTPVMVSDKSMVSGLWEFLFRKKEGLRPDKPLPSMKTDLHKVSREDDLLVWMGHSTYYLQSSGRRILVDPVFFKGSPLVSVNREFEGSTVYKPEDVPDLDYVFITHDHWDHLDHEAILALKGRVGVFVCGLGVGEHLEYWGVDKDKIVELDWNESAELAPGVSVHCLPARHFSGRGLRRNRTLWVSFMLETPKAKIYIGGDSGYDTHFAGIGKRFGKVDLAILENGQYDMDWRYIHIMPDELPKAARDLNADRLFTVHNSKYALARHSWHAPLDNISEAAARENIKLLTPMIGECVRLDDDSQTFTQWWKE